MAGGADPAAANRQALMRALRGFVLGARRGMERRRQRARGGDRDGAVQATLQDLPDFLLAFLVFILAEHPDLPRGSDLELLMQRHGSGPDPAGSEHDGAEDEDTPCTLQEALAPFAHMFQVCAWRVCWSLAVAGPGGEELAAHPTGIERRLKPSVRPRRASRHALLAVTGNDNPSPSPLPLFPPSQRRAAVCTGSPDHTNGPRQPG